MTHQHITAFLIYALTSWAAWILQYNKIYQGDYGEIIRGVLSLVSIIGRIVVAVYVILLFFVDSFSWYSPIVIAVCGEIANVVLLTPAFSIICGRNFLLVTLAHLLAMIGLIASIVVQVLFFRANL